MTFDYDVESSIITDCFFETNLVGTFDSNYSTYVNNNCVLQDMLTINDNKKSNSSTDTLQSDNMMSTQNKNIFSPMTFLQV